MKSFFNNDIFIVAYNPLFHRHHIHIIFANVTKKAVTLDDTKKFGERIRSLRKEQGLSQEKFALLIDMDRTYYASVEAGKRNISICNIKKIADGLGFTLEELVSRPV